MNLLNNINEEGMSKILLTGATGFLGSYLLKGLLENTDHEVVVLKRSFSNISRIEKLLKNPRVKIYDVDNNKPEKAFEENEIETVIHCATNYGRKNENVLEIVNSNFVFPLTLLKLAVDNNVKNFINTDTTIDKNVNFYSLSKKQFLDWLKEFSPKIKTINMQLEHFYGPFDNDTKFPTFIIRQFIQNVNNINLTKGEQKRCFVYVEDVVDAFLSIINNIKNIEGQFSDFEVSTEESITIKKFVLLAKELTQNSYTKLNFGALDYRENELMESKTDISAMKRLGWFPKIGLREGLQKLIDSEVINV